MTSKKQKTRKGLRKRLSKTRRRRILRALNRYPFRGGGGPTNPAMVIVEPRPHHKLAAVLENFHERMPLNWKLYVFHGKSSAEFAAQAAAPIQGKGRKIFLMPLDTDNLTADQYNALFNTKDFWNRIDAEEILIFQTDTALCGNPLKRPIDEFLKYDYIGCAYNNTQIADKNSPWPGAVFYGVGGLSLRKTGFTLSCIDKYGGKGLPEDVLFSKCVHESPNKPESAQRIADFCAQSSIGSDRVFGIHKTHFEYRGDRNALYNLCPEAKIIE